MIWGTIAALMLTLSTFPIWIYVAIVWGLFMAAATFVSLLSSLLDAPSVDVAQIWLVPLGAVFQGLSSAWSVPSGIWTWAKLEHPWWAVLISLVCFTVFAARR